MKIAALPGPACPKGCARIDPSPELKVSNLPFQPKPKTMPDNRSVWTIQGSGNGCLDWSKYNRLKCVWVFGRKLDLHPNFDLLLTVHSPEVRSQLPATRELHRDGTLQDWGRTCPIHGRPRPLIQYSVRKVLCHISHRVFRYVPSSDHKPNHCSSRH